MIRINLLKPEKKEIREIPSFTLPEYEEKKKPPIGNLILVLLLIALVAFFFSQKRAIDNENELLEIARQEKKSLQDVIVKLEELEKQKAVFEKKINLITDLKAQQEVAVRLMDELSKNLPEWVWLTETSYDNKLVQLKGKALSNNLIADFIYNLEKSDYFNTVNLISSTQRTVRNDQFLEFSMTARFEPLSQQKTGGGPTENPQKKRERQ